MEQTKQAFEFDFEAIFQSIDFLSAIVYDENCERGFWKSGICVEAGTEAEEELEDLEKIKRLFLMITEVCEAGEGIRKRIGASEHIPEYTNLEEEMADTVIRVMDFCAGNGLLLGSAIKAKLEFNRTRGYKHGGKKF
jgi:NTP pyrophosphatase (non-canonical NTP hydrolase)